MRRWQLDLVLRLFCHDLEQTEDKHEIRIIEKRRNRRSNQKGKFRYRKTPNKDQTNND